MRSAFWISLAVIVYTYAGYPVLMALLAKLRPRPWKRESLNKSVAIVMAVRNGEALLPWKINHLLSIDPQYVAEIIFVSDGSTDNTNELLRTISDPRAKFILLPQQVGKATALNHGIAAAHSEILLFTDIRPEIQSGAIASLVSNFADPRVGCVAGELIVRSTKAHDATTQNMGGLYWRYEQWMRNCEAAFDSPVGVYGGFYAARRALVSPAPDGLILDDMFHPLNIIRQGYRSVVDRSAVVIDIWPASTGGEFRRKVRTLAGNFQLLTAAPWVLSFKNRVLFQLVSHKLLRLIVPYLFLLMLICSWTLGTHNIAWLITAAVLSLFVVVAALSLRIQLPLVGRLVSAAGALLLLNAAAVVALYTALFTRGPLWKIWSPTSLAAPPLAFTNERKSA
ncbi:MAG: glycosyltransferase [Acidobacteria bacterium]|nr:glycosyltransferase [Acidobacteriota bacterium]